MGTTVIVPNVSNWSCPISHGAETWIGVAASYVQNQKEKDRETG